MYISSIIEKIKEINNVQSKNLNLHTPVFIGNEREYVLDSINTTFVSSIGGYVDKFEHQLCDITKSTNAIVCTNGTVALQVGLKFSGVKNGDLVLTQALTFIATANAITHAGANPVFLDIDDDTLGLSPESLQKFLEENCYIKNKVCIHRKTKKRISACVPMHTFGLCCRIDTINEICKHWNIVVVEDAAEALGSYYKNKHAGTFGICGILSFNGNKIVTTGGGGAILTDNNDIADTIRHHITAAKIPHPWKIIHDSIGYNFRMPALNAALGCAQLEQLDFFIQRKRLLAQKYKILFDNTRYQFIDEISNCSSNYWLCSIIAPNEEERDLFINLCHDKGVLVRAAWENINTLPMYKKCIHDNLEKTRKITKRIINLPSGVYV